MVRAPVSYPTEDPGGTLMTDATHLKARRTAAGLGLKKRGFGRKTGRTKGGLNSKPHTLTDGRGRPLRMILTAGQVSDCTGARILMRDPPPAKTLAADRGCDADWLRKSLKEKAISPCIPSRKNRRAPIPHDAEIYKERHKIENCFAKIKDWRRVAMRCDRCPDVFLSACMLAADVKFWL